LDTLLAPRHLGDEEGHLQALPAVEAGVAAGLVGLGEVGLGEILGAAGALGDGFSIPELGELEVITLVWGRRA
jgi:hypothetical protein